MTGVNHESAVHYAGFEPRGSFQDSADFDLGHADAARCAVRRGFILSTLTGEKLLLSDTPKGPVRLALAMRAVGFYFPQLFPEDSLDDRPPGR